MADSPLPLTPAQSKALTFIRGYIHEHGRSPSFDEIAAAIGSRTSKSNAHRVVQKLVERGALLQEPGLARSLRIVPDRPVTLDLPPDLDRKVRAVAAEHEVSVEFVILDALPGSICILHSRSAAMTLSTCSRCGKSHGKHSQRYCAKCHAAYQRQWRRNRTLELHSLRKRLAALASHVKHSKSRTLGARP